MENDKIQSTIKAMNETTFGIIPVRKTEGKNSFLLVKSRSGNWGFPKGHPKKDEAPVSTALRELEEETGLTQVKILSNTFSEARVYVDVEHTVTKVVIWFLGVVQSNEEVNIQDKEEIVDYKWLRFDDAHALLTHEETKRMFLDARLYLSKIEGGDTAEGPAPTFIPVTQ